LLEPERRLRPGASRCRSRSQLFVALVAPVGESMTSLTVRQRLVRCLSAVNGIYIGPVRSGTSQVAILNIKVRRVTERCDGDYSVGGTRAGRALLDLSVGVSLYQQYLHGVAFERPQFSTLRQAQRWIADGKAEARAVLR
jgi:hypothetical protein